MASFVYNEAARLISVSGGIDLEHDTLKVMLVGSGYVPDRDHNFVDESGGDDPIDHEVSGITGYTNGWGSSSRKTLEGVTITTDDDNDRVVFDANDLVWATLGAGAAIARALVIKEGAADDTTSRLVICVDFADYNTNGGDFPLIFNSGGIVRWNTVVA